MSNPKKPCGNCLYCNEPLNSYRKKYCDNTCQNNYQYEKYIEKWKVGLETGFRAPDSISHHIRRYLFIKYNNRCQQCGWSKVNPITNLIPLTIDHINGDWHNCKEDNLRLLCFNCHALTPTFGSLNIGRGRRSITGKTLGNKYYGN
jgi:hypothetical protein